MAAVRAREAEKSGEAQEEEVESGTSGARHRRTNNNAGGAARERIHQRRRKTRRKNQWQLESKIHSSERKEAKFGSRTLSHSIFSIFTMNTSLSDVRGKAAIPLGLQIFKRRKARKGLIRIKCRYKFLSVRVGKRFGTKSYFTWVLMALHHFLLFRIVSNIFF